MVSIIIPCYNAAKTLPKCIDSVLGQTFRDIELILVDDASTDSTLSLLRKYESHDSRVKVVAFEANKGVDQARFAGLGAASGEYIMFVDSDDWL